MQFVRGDDESAVCLPVPDINHAQIPSTGGLPYRHTRSFSTGTVLARILQDLFDFLLFDAVIPNVRAVRRGIKVEAKIHRYQYTRAKVKK
jgi:hypothetical protein